MKNRILHILLFLLPLVAAARSYRAEDVAMVHLQDRTQYVCNPDSILDANSVAVMNAALRQLEDSTGIEVVVVVVEQIADGDCFNFAFNIGEKNGVGKASRDNGLEIGRAHV